MPFDWTEYLTLARELAQRTEESALRSAISRAYYAVYGTCRARLAEEGFTLPGDGADHRAVWDIYLNSSSDVGYYIGLDGSRLRRLRNAADYDTEIENLANRAQRALSDAARILDALARL